MKYLVIVFVLFFFGCTIEEHYSDSEKIIGEWFGSGVSAHFKNGDILQYLRIDDCKRETTYVFYEDGTLFEEDFIYNDPKDGSTDFCITNELTSTNGNWEFLSMGNLKITLKNTSNNSVIVTEPYSIEFIGTDQLNIRYQEFEENQQDSVAYFVHHFLRFYNFESE